MKFGYDNSWYSIDHASIGSRRTGSAVHVPSQAYDWITTDPDFQQWATNARPMDTWDIPFMPGTFVTRWVN